MGNKDLKWFDSKARWTDGKNEYRIKRLSKENRDTFPKALLDDIDKKYYILFGYNYLGEASYIETGEYGKDKH